MTDKEIIKALECCADLFDCISCPCKDFCGDLGKLQQNALDLINRQQAEVERLRKANGLLEYVTKAVHHVKIGGEDWTIDFKTKEAMFEEINKKIDTLCNIQTSRAEAIKEFADRLKEKLVEESYDDWQFFKVVGESEIDDLVKEMAGEQE